MYKLKIITIGKTKDRWMQEGIDKYSERLKSTMAIEWILAKDNQKLKQLLEKESSYLCLDPRGKLFTSEEFSQFLVQELQDKGSRLTIVIGDAEGLPEEIRREADKLISFSPLTFTHDLTRLLLLEQLYRALEIQRGSGYHKR